MENKQKHEYTVKTFDPHEVISNLFRKSSFDSARFVLNP